MKHIYYPALILTAITMVMLGCKKDEASNASSSGEAPAVKLPVDGVVVSLKPLHREEALAATILPYREVMISSEVSKKITAILFKDGSYVEKGQALYKLDDSDLTARLKQVTAELNLAKLNESRMSELLKSNSVRQEEYDMALAKLHSLQGSEELIRSELNKTLITAPFPGRIGITKVHAGSLVHPGMELVGLQEQGSVKIQFSVPETFAHLVKSSREVQFMIPNHQQRFKAEITAMEPGLDRNNRGIVVHAVASNKDGLFKAGMSAKIYFNASEEGSMGFALPTEALMPGEKGYNVFAVKGGQARITPVTVGERNETHATITGGLNNGDTVMISNMLRAGDGMPVDVVTVK